MSRKGLQRQTAELELAWRVRGTEQSRQRPLKVGGLFWRKAVERESGLPVGEWPRWRQAVAGPPAVPTGSSRTPQRNTHARSTRGAHHADAAVGTSWLPSRCGGPLLSPSAIPLTRGPQSHSQHTVERQQQPPPPRGPSAVSPQASLLCRSSQPLGEEAAGQPPPPGSDGGPGALRPALFNQRSSRGLKSSLWRLQISPAARERSYLHMISK